MGIYFTGHPISRFQEHLSSLGCTSVKDVLDGKVSGRVSLIGIITRLKKRQNRKKEEWAQFVIEDCTGSILINAFAKTWQQINTSVAPNAILCFSGEVKIDDESARLEMNLKHAQPMADVIAQNAEEITIRLSADYPQENLQKLKNLLDTAKGSTTVFLEMPSKENPKKVHRIRTDKSILIHDGLLRHIEKTLGENAWTFK